jgi:hypothetical protein
MLNDITEIGSAPAGGDAGAGGGPGVAADDCAVA